MSDDFYRNSIVPYSGMIIKICRAYTSTQEDFEDYYQEVCLQVWRSRDNFQERSEWSTWIYRIALNVCMTMFKRDKKFSGQVSDEQFSQLSTENQAFSSESLNELYTAIRQLNEVDRAIILLYLEEYPNSSVAEIMGTNANNIGVRITRIKQKLRNILDGKIN